MNMRFILHYCLCNTFSIQTESIDPITVKLNNDRLLSIGPSPLYTTIGRGGLHSSEVSVDLMKRRRLCNKNNAIKTWQ